MMSLFINQKIQAILSFLGSFGLGAFIENHSIIANFFGSIAATIIVGLINSSFNKKNKEQ